MNIAFYASGGGTRLKKILKAANQEFIESIKFVFYDGENTALIEDELKINQVICIHCAYNQLSDDNNKRRILLSNILLDALKKNEVDFCFSFGGHILCGNLLNKYQNRIINFHPSLLPLFPGLKAIDQAIAANVKLLGNTAHFIDSGIDTGPIIMQSVIHVDAFYNGGYNAVLDLQIDMLFRIFELLQDGQITVMGRNVMIETATYNESTIFPKVEEK